MGGTAAAPTVGVEAYFDPTSRETLIGQANLEWHVTTGGIDHIILLGGEFTTRTKKHEEKTYSATGAQLSHSCWPPEWR